MSSFSFLINYFTIYFEKKKKNKTILCNSKIVLFLVLLFSEK